MSAIVNLQPAYPLDAFPRALWMPALEVQQNIQAPLAMVGMAVLGAASLACQGLIDVKLPVGKICSVSLNLLCVATSGERKSTVDALMYAPFHEADKLAVIRHQAAIENHRVETRIWKMKDELMSRALRKSARGSKSYEGMLIEQEEHVRREPKLPRLRLFIRENITSPALVGALEGDGESIGLITDEGDVLFKSDAMRHLGTLNRAWDSPPTLPLDRVENGNFFVFSPRLTVSIQTQPSVLRKYLEKGGDEVRGSGHLARYLVAWPASMQGFRWVRNAEAEWHYLPSFHDRMKELIATYGSMMEAGAADRHVIEFSEDAKARWFQLAAETEWLQRPGDPLHEVHDFASKAMEVLARVAALFHYVSGEEGRITIDTVERALAVIRWHIGEAKRLFSTDLVQPQDQVDARATAKYLRFHVWRGPASYSWVAKNHLLRNGPVRGRNRLNDALDYLSRIGAIWIGVAPANKQKFVNLNDTFFATMVQ